MQTARRLVKGPDTAETSKKNLAVSRAAGAVGKDVRTLASADDMWHTG